MKNFQDRIKAILWIAGIIEILIGFFHFGMPYFAYQAKGFSFLNQNEINFITLCVFAVGILLIAFGSLTIILSLKAPIEILLYYSVTKSFLWLARIILEILYPVKIPLFFVEQPTITVVPLLIFEWLLFVSSVALMVRMKKTA